MEYLLTSLFSCERSLNGSYNAEVSEQILSNLDVSFTDILVIVFHTVD